MTQKLLFLLLFGLAACGDDGDKTPPESLPPSDSGGEVDGDGDGVPEGEDCDDADPAVSPSAEERCDGVDNDCDGAIDDDATDASSWTTDADGDGFGAGEPILACEAPEGAVSQDGDCDDADARYNPGAEETDCADPNDYNCDGSTGYADEDGDGFAACQECDDGDAAVNPDAVEVCDGRDNNCDGLTDGADAADAQTVYADTDGDGFGDADFPLQSCELPEGYAARAEDCDDEDGAVNPDATELCDARDNDCDGTIDEPDAADAQTYYADRDGDGHGDADYSLAACETPTGYVSTAEDCDDGDGAVSPDGLEVCDRVDNDCDGTTDEPDAADAQSFYDDGDGDGYGDPAAVSRACAAPSGSVSDNTDCDDGDGGINPGAAEACDGLDNDCDGGIDDGVLGSGAACAASSCGEILADQPSAPSGDYSVSSDGVVSVVECDMDEGCAVVVDEDFESGASSAWSLRTTYGCSSFSTILGGYGIIAGGTIQATWDVSAYPHTEALVSLAYIKLDSWDGEAASAAIDGVNFWSEALYYYDGAEVCGWNRGYEGSYDERHELSATVAHSADTITLSATSALNQDAGDESFGIDDVRICLR
ncbi:putative metal-binding motif-containing protein [Myxococcota bacterium]|nr:putative metal-binding motif-containing protein [Myxococcota bacterium]